MRPALAALASTQAGLFTRQQATDCGYSASEQRALLRPLGPWCPVRRGVYVLREVWESTKPPERLALIDRAVHLTLVVDHMLSHDSAARAHAIPMLRRAEPLAHITRTGIWGSRTDNGVKHHLTRFDLPESVEVDGLRVTRMARTALDLAREHGYLAGLIATDHALHLGTPEAEFEAELARMWCWPYVSMARAAYFDADPGAETIAETLGRTLLVELDLGPVETQFPVRIDDGTIYWCDLRIGNHIVEVDGRIKYLDRAAGGVADVAATEVLLRERRRQLEVCSQGLGMSRLDWRDVYGPGRTAAAVRLRREYAVTAQRFGDQLDPRLAARAAAIRTQHPRRHSA